MKVFAVLLASIFLVSALPTGKKVIISDDGSLTIHDQSLRQITLAKPLGVNGEALVDLVINHPTIPRKSIVLNVEYRQYGSGHKQVAQILNYFLPYNGQYISEETYQHILDQIQADVQNKQISPVLYAACEALTHDELFQQLVRGEGIFAYDTEILGTAVTGDLLNKVHTGIGQPTAKKIILNKDGSLTIYDQALRQITLTRSVSLEAEKWLEIVLNAPGIPVKTIVLNIDAEKYGPRREQLDHLYQILLSFDGKYITEETYLNILVHVRNAVQQWEISPVVYNVLKALDHDELFQQLVLGQGVFVRDAYLVGVPLTGKTINKVYEVEDLHRNQWNHGPYNAVYGVPFTGINQVEDLHRSQWTHGPYNALYGQQYHPRYLEVLNKIYGYGHPLYQHQGEQLYHPEHTLGQRYWYGQGINHHLPQHYGVWGRLNHLQGQVY